MSHPVTGGTLFGPFSSQGLLLLPKDLAGLSRAAIAAGNNFPDGKL